MQRPIRLIGVAEVAEMAGVSKTRAHAFVNRPDFPAVYAVRPIGRRTERLWLPAEVEVWASRRREELEARRRRMKG